MVWHQSPPTNDAKNWRAPAGNETRVSEFRSRSEFFRISRIWIGFYIAPRMSSQFRYSPFFAIMKEKHTHRRRSRIRRKAPLRLVHHDKVRTPWMNQSCWWMMLIMSCVRRHSLILPFRSCNSQCRLRPRWGLQSSFLASLARPIVMTSMASLTATFHRRRKTSQESIWKSIKTAALVDPFHHQTISILKKKQSVYTSPRYVNRWWERESCLILYLKMSVAMYKYSDM